MSKDIELSILIPCLNEELNVQGALTTVCAAAKDVGCSYEVLVMDDGSTDATFQKACEFRDQHPDLPIRVHRNPRNRGFGGCFYDGASLTSGKYYRICCGDNVEPVATLKKIFGSMGKADIIAPYHPSVPDRSMGRKLLSSTYTVLVNTLSGYHLKYYNGCALVRREDVLKCKSRSDGFGFQANMITQMLDGGATILEFPVDSTERQTGSSKALTLKSQVQTAKVLIGILSRRVQRLSRGR